MLSESDGSTKGVDTGKTHLAYRGRRAGRAYKGFPGTWEILLFPFENVPERGSGLPTPWPLWCNTEHWRGANLSVSEGTAELKENQVKQEEQQEVGASQ